MNYLSVKDRCAVDFGALQLPITVDQSLEILKKKGFREIEVDLSELARQRITASTYRFNARPSEAPDIINCSSLIKWLYGQKGIWLPRRAVQQREFGITVEISEASEGDIVFASGFSPCYVDDSGDGVGHVSIVTGIGTVIYGSSRKAGIIESSLEAFVSKTHFRGIRRMIPQNVIVRTFITPTECEIECSDDFRWIILSSI